MLDAEIGDSINDSLNHPSMDTANKEKGHDGKRNFGLVELLVGHVHELAPQEF